MCWNSELPKGGLGQKIKDVDSCRGMQNISKLHQELLQGSGQLRKDEKLGEVRESLGAGGSKREEAMNFLVWGLLGDYGRNWTKAGYSELSCSCLGCPPSWGVEALSIPAL